MYGKLIFNPGDAYHVEQRLWQGCPTVLRAGHGTLFAGWYSGGTREPSLRNYNLLVRSRDGGLTWSEPLLVIESRRAEKLLYLHDSQGKLDLQSPGRASYSGFRKFFKRVNRIAPHEFVMTQRIYHAMELLRNHALQIQEVAMRCGFNDFSSFSRLFRQKTGHSPSRYRKVWLDSGDRKGGS